MINTSTIGYIGFDCTAKSLHVGSLLQIMILKLMQRHGHRPVILLGGGTTLIGDPSGKDSTRKILDCEPDKIFAKTDTVVSGHIAETITSGLVFLIASIRGIKEKRIRLQFRSRTFISLSSADNKGPFF